MARKAIVTGGSAGIGKATAVALAQAESSYATEASFVVDGGLMLMAAAGSQ